jgi:hypothetical protein
MNAMGTADLVGRGSRTPKSVRRGYGASGRSMLWAARRAEPRPAVRHQNPRCCSPIEIATTWARLGEGCGLTNPVPMKREFSSRKCVCRSGASPHQL